MAGSLEENLSGAPEFGTSIAIDPILHENPCTLPPPPDDSMYDRTLKTLVICLSVASSVIRTCYYKVVEDCRHSSLNGSADDRYAMFVRILETNLCVEEWFQHGDVVYTCSQEYGGYALSVFVTA